MRRKKVAHGEGFWPGFVDALTNVVLNLLFLAGVFSVGIFSLSLDLSRQIKAKAANEALAERPIRVFKVAPQNNEFATLKSQAVSIAQFSGTRVIKVRFSTNNVLLAEGVKKELLDHLHNLDLRNLKFTVFDSVSDESKTNRREGYLRILAVREQLMKAGVVPNQIESKMFYGIHESGSEGRLVTVLIQNITESLESKTKESETK